MKRLPAIICWVGLVVLGAVTGVLLRPLGTDVNSVLLATVGTLGAIATGFAWSVLRRLDELKNFPGLDRDRSEILSQKISARRGPMFRRWVLSFVAGVAAASCGGLLRVASIAANPDRITVVGYSAALLLIASALLLVVEYQALSRLGTDLTRELKDATAKQDFLRKVCS